MYAAATTAVLFAASAASAGSVFIPIPSDYESNLRLLFDMSMRSTYGPTQGEGDGMPRYETGLYPPATIDLDLPELRSASPLAALRWSNRWREIITAAFGGERAMNEYWQEGASHAGDAMFSVLEIGEDLLQSDGRRRTIVNERLESVSQPTVGRALSFAKGSGISGGGSSGGGGPRAEFADLAPSTGEQTPTPIVPPEAMPPAPGTPPVVEAPSEPTILPVDETPTFVLNLDEIDWANPTFNQSPPPPLPDGDAGPNDGQGITGGPMIAIPAPTAVGLGAAGLLALGARMRRRGLI